MILFKRLIYLLIILLLPFIIRAQANSYSDAAQMYNRLLLEKGNSVVQIGNYKVKGTPYLYGGKQKGELFVKGQNEAIVHISYNTYEQIVEYSFSASNEEQLYKPKGTVDSFKIFKNDDLQIGTDLLFISGKNIFATDNDFYQKVFFGTRFSLFKRYKSDLGIVTTNYVQSDLRQFDLSFDYFYLDTTTKKLKRLKTNPTFLKKEFKDHKEIYSITDNSNFSYDVEKGLIEIFAKLNLSE